MRSKNILVDKNTSTLNVRQDRNQWHLDIVEDGRQRFAFLNSRPKRLVQLQCHIGIFRSVRRSLLQSNLVEGQLIFTFASNLFKADRFMPEITVGQAVHVVTARYAV